MIQKSVNVKVVSLPHNDSLMSSVLFFFLFF